MATSEVSQFEGNDHHHSIGIARFHTNRGKLRIGIVQVEDCQLPKDFSGPPIRSRALVRKSIEGWSGASCCLLNFVIKQTDQLLWRVWLGICTPKNEVSTHGCWRGGLG